MIEMTPQLVEIEEFIKEAIITYPGFRHIKENKDAKFNRIVEMMLLKGLRPISPIELYEAWMDTSSLYSQSFWKKIELDINDKIPTDMNVLISTETPSIMLLSSYASNHVPFSVHLDPCSRDSDSQDHVSYKRSRENSENHLRSSLSSHSSMESSINSFS